MEFRHCCEECGEGLIHLGPGPPPTRCEDCVPQVGPGSRLLDQFGINFRQLRVGAGRDAIQTLEEKTGVHVSTYESQLREREPELTSILRIAHTLGGSVDDLTDRIYWHPSRFAHPTADSEARRSSERLGGFFQVLAPNSEIFEPAEAPVPVADRRKSAEVFGGNLRDARSRRHLTQAALAEAAGLSKDAMTLIERGITETTTTHLFGLARALHLEPGALLDGMYWTPPASAGLARAERALPVRSRSRAPRREQCQVSAVGVPNRPSENLGAPSSIDPLAERFAANLRLHRGRSGLTWRQAAEAAEIDRTHWWKLERGLLLPRLNLLVKSAAAINVRCGLLTAGIKWNPQGLEFEIAADNVEVPSALERMGMNALDARRRLGAFQQTVAERAAMRRSEIAEIERGRRPFRIFAIVKLAAALELDFAELFAGIVDWSVRPLPAPEFAPGESKPTKAERDDELVQLWREGSSLVEIGDALGLESATVGHYICDLRDAGVHLPYRRPPRGAVEVAKRHRRARSTAAVPSASRRPA